MRLLEDIKPLGEEAWVTILSKSPENAPGAPLFGHDGHFAGLVVEPQGGRHRAAFVFDFIRLLRARYQEMDDDDQNFAAELARALNFDLGTTGLTALPRHRDFSAKAPVTEEPGEVFDPLPVTWTARPSLCTYALTPTASGAVLLAYDNGDSHTTRVNLALTVFPGFSLTAIKEGVIIAGGRNTAQRTAHLWSTRGLARLSDMPASHSYHCAACVVDTLVVVSGEATAEVSSLDSTAQSWQKQPAVPTQRAQAGATSYSRSLYVVGGVTQSGAVTDEVLQFVLDTHQWITISCRLRYPCSNAGVKVLERYELLVFGGTSADSKQVDKVFIQNLETAAVHFEGRLPEAAAFGGCGVTDDPDFLVFSSEQRLFMYREAKKEFEVLALPPPQ